MLIPACKFEQRLVYSASCKRFSNEPTGLQMQFASHVEIVSQPDHEFAARLSEQWNENDFSILGRTNQASKEDCDAKPKTEARRGKES